MFPLFWPNFAKSRPPTPKTSNAPPRKALVWSHVTQSGCSKCVGSVSECVGELYRGCVGVCRKCVEVCRGVSECVGEVCRKCVGVCRKCVEVCRSVSEKRVGSVSECVGKVCFGGCSPKDIRISKTARSGLPTSPNSAAKAEIHQRVSTKFRSP